MSRRQRVESDLRPDATDSNKQLSQPSGLGAKILVRHSDLSAEVSGSVPGPTRVKEHGPRERDHIGVSRAENGFGLLEFSDHADGNDGERRRLLHRPGKGNLIAGADWNLLSGTRTVLVLVVVPHELPAHFRDLHVLIVDLRDDFGDQ